jgi:glutamate-1-semialdehyde 2,1-aminomutase
MNVFKTEPVIESLYRQGERLRTGVEQVTARHGIQDYVQLKGRACNLVYATKGLDQNPSQAYRTLFMQELLRHGIIAPSFVISYSHTDDDVDQTIEAVDCAAEIYARALDDGVDEYLVGRPVKPVFRPFN